MAKIATAPAVVLCDGSNSLGVIRSLARVGVPSIAAAMSPQEIALHSRYPVRKLCLPPTPRDGAEQRLLELLLDLREHRPVLIPSSDRYVVFMQRHRRALAERFNFCLPSDELITALIDKALETELIARSGIALPKTARVLPEDPAELVRLLGLPLIIKPRSFAEVPLLPGKNLIVRSWQVLEEFYRSHEHCPGGFLAQEVVPGGDDALHVGSCTFNRRSELVSAFTFRKLRMTPAHFGVASFAVSEVNPRVVELAEFIARTVGYMGPTVFEFKLDARDQQYKYIEWNPRIGLCNYFDTVCGVNTAWYTYRVSRGEEVGRQRIAQRDGVIYCDLYEDLYASFKDGESPASVAAFYLRYWNRPRVGAFHCWSDLRPGLVAGIRSVKAVARTLRSKFGHKLTSG